MANSYRHRSGDRKEGRLLRSLPALNKFIPYLLRAGWFQHSLRRGL